MQVNKQKGTLKALKDALRSLNISPSIVEWWQDETIEKGKAVLTLNGSDIIYSEEQYSIIYKLVSEIKRLSLHILFKTESALKGKIFVGAGLIQTNRIYI